MIRRSSLARRAPPSVKTAVRQLRKALTPPPADERVLFDYEVVAEPNETPRLTLVIQFLNRGADFGGAATGIEIFARLALAMHSHCGSDFRVIISDAGPETDPTILSKYAARVGLAMSADRIELVSSANDRISVRPNEVFFTQIWWNMTNFAKVRARQAELFGVAPRPLIRLAQDYEPGWWEFSSAHMLARDAYDNSKPLWGIVNSGSLATYIGHMGHSFEKRFVFEPVVADALRPYLDKVASSTRERRILIYGRPSVARNCFGALMRGLRAWARDHPEFGDWEVLSAGEPHEPVPLGDGRKVTSIGKLSLEDYAEILLGSSVGVSLMASPHPSYPPLEMAHFGLRTVTNTYLCKDLSSFHPNIVSIPSIGEAALASAIAEACRRAAEPPLTASNDAYVRTDKYGFIPELASDLAAALGRA